MDDKIFWADQFAANRAHLQRVAFRMLGSREAAEDAVQEAWLKVSRADGAGVENPGGWLTTIVSRVCLDMLRSKRQRREDALAPATPEPAIGEDDSTYPERETLLAEQVGMALMVVLQTLPPLERVAFVLHDMFDLPFDDIGAIVERTPTAARQLASRARRRVGGATAEVRPDLARQRIVVQAFLDAARGGDMLGLLAVLAPDVVYRADAAAQRTGSKPALFGAEAVAANFHGRAQAARPALVDGVLGLAVAIGDGPIFVVLRLVMDGDRIAGLEAVADPQSLAAFEIQVLDELRTGGPGGGEAVAGQ